METKAGPSFIKQIEDRTVIGLVSVFGVVDNYGDRVWKGAFAKTLQERRGRVKHLWGHDWREPPIAKIDELREIDKRSLPKELRQKWPEATGALEESRTYLDTPRGNEVLTGLKAETITEMSFGYDSVKADFEEDDDEGPIRNLREVRLWDTSDVLWGANPATVAVKVAVPYKDTGTADEGEAWSKPTLSDFTEDSWDDLSSGERRRIMAHYAWAPALPPETFEELKLPHHRAGREGIGSAIWSGVSAAMARLLQAGTDIPSGQRRAVYNHLAKHYEQYEKEPPDFKLIELACSVGAVLAVPDGGALPTLNGLAVKTEELFERLRDLHALLTAAEPPARALTVRADRAKRIELALAISQARKEAMRL